MNTLFRPAPCYIFICIVGYLLFLPICISAGQETVDEITFLNWGEYMDPALIEKFEKEYQIKVRTITFDSDDNRTGMLIATEGENFDVALIDGQSIEAYRRRGWLAPISEDNIPNISHIESKWRTAYAGAKEYSVPYFWGTIGIAYRKDLAPTPIMRWMQMFRPAPELQGKMFMLPQSRELIDLALKSLGYSVNTTEETAYNEARQLLLAQKPFVKKYDIPALHENSALVKGTVIAAVTYSGDAMALIDIEKNITYVAPEEGGILWVDYLVIMKKSKKKKAAETFINFLNIPENAARLAQFVHYASPNREAAKLLPPEFLNDTTIYPSAPVLEKYEIEKILPPRIHRIRTSIFADVTNGKI
jgi:spermidine/putrescine transport system substrate-binding protein